MISLIGPELAAYVEAHTTPESALLSRLRAETEADLPMPQMQVGRVEGAFLRMIVALARPRAILEIGTYSGYSTISMASALPDGAALVTCDIDPKATAVARRYFAESGHGHKIDLRLGPALDTIAALAAEGRTFDLVFIDADKPNYSNYWDAVLPLVPTGGLVLADNTLWSGRVVDPREDSDRGLAAFNDRVAGDARVEHVLLSVRDGIMMARKLRD